MATAAAIHKFDNLNGLDVNLDQDDRQSHITVASTEKSIKQTPSAPLISKNKSRFSEKDLLMLCVDTPKYLSKALGHD